MLKQLFCMFWGHKRIYWTGGIPGMISGPQPQLSKFCLRCGTIMEM